MNAPFKFLDIRYSVGYRESLKFLFISAILIFLTFLTMTSLQAAPCFDNPQQAYDYLLAQEKYETQAREQAPVNINRAAEGELVSLNGIGSSKAQEIILYREMFGDFKSVDELEKVKGIGAKTIEKNRSRLRVHN